MDDERIAITKVQPRKVERPEHRDDDSRTNRPVDPMELGPVPTLPGDYELTLWDKIRLGPMLLPSLFIITKGLLMKDLKTTISGIVKAIFLILSVFGISTGNLTEALVSAVLWGIAEIYQSIWTPDKKD